MDKPYIILVDDQEEVLKALTEDMQKEYQNDFFILSCKSAKEAKSVLEIILNRNEKVALIIADQRMPDKKGLEFFLEIKDRFPETQKVILTAYAEPEDIQEALNYFNNGSIQQFIIKPWSPPEEKLYPILNQLLSKYEHASIANILKPFYYIEDMDKDVEELSIGGMNLKIIDNQRFDFARLWQLYIDTGFIYEEKKKLLQPYMKTISENWDKLLKSDLTKTYILNTGGQDTNSISAVNFFSNTWIVQHMVSKSNPIGNLIILSHLLEQMNKDNTIKYAKFFYRPNNKGPARIFGDMNKTMPEIIETSLYSFFKKELTTYSPSNTDSRFMIEALNDKNFPQYNFFIKNNYTELQRLVEGYDDALNKIDETKKKFQQNNLKRDRHLFLLFDKQGNETTGILLLEDSSVEFNFSQLLNSFRIKVGKDVKDKELVFNTLINFAEQFYFERRFKYAVSYVEPEFRDFFLKNGYEHSKDYVFVIGKKENNGFIKASNHIKNYYQNFLMRWLIKHAK